MNKGCDFVKNRKKIVTLSLNTSGKMAIHDYLINILKDYADITSLLIDNVEKDDLLDADVIVLSVIEVYYKRPDLLKDLKYVISKRTINYKNLVEIFSIEDGLNVYVVNDTELSTKETILHLQEIGITQYNLIPFYPGCLQKDENIYTAITIGEPDLVPKHVTNTINIGSRVIDISSIYEIITKLNLSLDLINDFTASYLKDFIEIIRISNKQLHSINKTQLILKNTFENTSSGMCVINPYGVTNV